MTSQLVDVAVIAYGSNQRTAGGFRSVSEPMPFEAQYQPRNPITAYALAASRYMHEFGATSEDFGLVSVADRRHAATNPNAYFYEQPITLRHILTHTAGFEEDSRDLFTVDSARIIPLREWAATRKTS